MKTKFRVCFLLLSLCMIFVLTSFTNANAANAATNVTLTVDKSEVNAGDTVTVVIENADLIASGFGIYMEFDNNLLECTQITGADGDEYMGMYQLDKKAPWVTAQVADDVDNTNSDGIFSFGVAIGSNKQLFEGIVATLTFTAKEAGTVTFTLNEDTSGTDAFKGVAQTQIITIKEAHTCSAETLTYSSGFRAQCEYAGRKDCYQCSCGKIYEDAEAKVIIEDFAAWRNEGGNGYIAPTGHLKWDDLGVALDVEGDYNGIISVKNTFKCIACGYHWVYNVEATSFEVIDTYEGNCQNYAYKTYKATWEDYVDADGNAIVRTFSGDVSSYVHLRGPVNTDRHIRGTEYRDITDTTHSVYYECCDALVEENVPHTYTNGVCACKVKQTFSITLFVDGVQYGDVLTFEYGATVTVVDPTKAADGCTSYTFSGWDKEIPATMPAENLTFNATFTEGVAHASASDKPTDNGDGTHSYKCSACGQTVGETEEHNGGTAYCNAKPVCEDCGVAYDWYDYNNHASTEIYYTNIYTETHTVKYSCCDRTYLDKVPHDYTQNEEHKCVCGDIEPANLILNYNGGYVERPSVTTVTLLSKYNETTVDFRNLLNPVNGDKILVGWNTKADGSGENVVIAAPYLHLETLTVYAQWRDPHICAPVDYDDNGDGTHTVKCSCGETINTAESHNFNNDAHKCACGKVETFTLEIYDWMTETKLLATIKDVPYGANLMSYLNNITVEDIVDNDGKYEFLEWLWYVDGSSNWVTDECTMPGVDSIVYANFTYTGWVLWAEGIGYMIRDLPLTGWNEIEGAWYYFDLVTCVRAEGLTHVPYPAETINGIIYAPDQQTLDYCASKGIDFIDAEEAWFLFDENGKFTATDYTGIYINDKVTMFIEDGMGVWHPGLVFDEVNYYYFTGDLENGGNTLAKGDVYILNNCTDREVTLSGIYTFDSNGKLCEFDGITEYNGKLRYYKDAQLMIGNGLTKIGDNYIYVRNNGELVVNAEYYVSVNTLGVVAGLYEFDADGYMVEPKSTGVNGIVDDYYYEDGKIVYGAGLIEYNGGYIYVRSSGKVATGTYWITNTNGLKDAGKYEFDEDGMMLEVKNGVVDGYYYVNNHIQYGVGLIETDDGIYYVRSDGHVAVGDYYVTNISNYAGSEYKAGDKLLFGADGKLITG